jgi:RimJ/RimL family protein N-acetyltransferase
LIHLASLESRNSLPVLARDGLRLREVHESDAAALTALFKLPEVSQYLDTPPGTIDEFIGWIALSRSRRAEGKAACFSLLTGQGEVSGLFMALRLETPDHAEIGFALSPRLWGTGIFVTAIELYLDFLFTHWDVQTLVGKTSALNGRGVGVMRKLGVTVIAENEKNGAVEYVWTLERDAALRVLSSESNPGSPESPSAPRV